MEKREKKGNWPLPKKIVWHMSDEGSPILILIKKENIFSVIFQFGLNFIFVWHEWSQQRHAHHQKSCPEAKEGLLLPTSRPRTNENKKSEISGWGWGDNWDEKNNISGANKSTNITLSMLILNIHPRFCVCILEYSSSSWNTWLPIYHHLEQHLWKDEKFLWMCYYAMQLSVVWSMQHCCLAPCKSVRN